MLAYGFVNRLQRRRSKTVKRQQLSNLRYLPEVSFVDYKRFTNQHLLASQYIINTHIIIVSVACN